MSTVTAVIVSYNTKDYLRRCIECLMASDIAQEIKITVVDNASSDGSAEMVAAEFPQAELICPGENLGFGRANNLALKKLDTPYALLINSDAFVREDTVRLLLEHMEDSPRCAICGPRALNADGSLQYSCRTFPGIGISLLHGFVGKLFPNNPASRSYLMKDHDHTLSFGVDWVSGLCMMIRKEAAQQLGGFDERYFFYVEDVDLCRRAHRLGWQVDFVGRAVLTHLIDASGGRRSPRMIRAHHDSMWMYYKDDLKGCRLAAPLVWAGIKLRLLLMLALNGLKK